MTDTAHPNVPTREEVIDACENVLTRATTLSEGMRNLLQTTVDALKHSKVSNLQKTINTWRDILGKRGLPQHMYRYANAAATHLEKLKQ